MLNQTILAHFSQHFLYCEDKSRQNTTLAGTYSYFFVPQFDCMTSSRKFNSDDEFMIKKNL